MSFPRASGRPDPLELDIVATLADAGSDQARLRRMLELLWQRLGEQVLQLEGVTAPSGKQSLDSPPTLNLLTRFKHQIRILQRVIRISDRNQGDLKRLNQALEQASTHDQLTGLTNRRFMTDRCRQEDRRLDRHGGSYALLLLDADHFKLINDNHGHDVGDLALIQLAQAFRRSLRHEDLCSRWGGEEFLALLIEANLEAAQGVAERSLEASRAIRIQTGSGEVTVTVSIGIAAHADGETYAETLKRADDALYEAKRLGRNRFVVSRG